MRFGEVQQGHSLSMGPLFSLSWSGLPQNQILKLGSSIGLVGWGGDLREDEKGSMKVIQEEKAASYPHGQLGHWAPQMSSTCRERGEGGVGWGKDFPTLVATAKDRF